MSEPVSVSREIAAPERMHALVCDLPRMGERSPEHGGGLAAAAEAG